ncbi:MAG: polymer-forming cytoskeletal protein [Erysipelotrichaceae bacterium]|nr:polymer-forming cytoskeletal protein [Erysipelotrichaceae bacterium]MBO4537445.1 polymer-forming cytoskeletal protein [Erysipelotrichaceae bacterium]MBR5049019.1 polymer-forming cytoskeletal protein [Erysipelotrichaceae bacterium]
MSEIIKNEEDLEKIISDMDNIDGPDMADVPLFQETAFETPFAHAERPKTTYTSRVTSGVDDETTVIGASTVVNSNVTCGGNIEIRGSIMGKLVVQGTAVIYGSVEGDIEAGELTIKSEGKVNGNIVCQNDFTMEQNSNTVGNVNAKNASIEAAIQGNVDVVSVLRIGGSAIINGDITAENLSVDGGAVINGRLTIRR